MTTEPSPTPGVAETPGVRRRLACFIYEGVLLFGVVMIAGLLWSVLTQQRHALEGQTAMQAFLFVLLGAYFTYFWTRTGQTLAMQTWQIRLVTTAGQPVGLGRALARYLLSWLWFIPALLAVHLAGLKGSWPTFGAVTIGVLTYALLARLHPRKQFLHDLACGTRLVRWKRSTDKRG